MKRDRDSVIRRRILIGFAIDVLLFVASMVLWPDGDDFKLDLRALAAFTLLALSMLPFAVLPIMFWLARPDVKAVRELRRRLRERAAEEERKRATWPRGRATVLRLTDLGGRENDSIQARCELEIRSEDFRSSPYRASLELFVPPLGVPRVVPGSTVPVAIDPADKNAIVILWEEP